MKTVKLQSFIDLGMERYGNVDAVPELMKLNNLNHQMDNATFVPDGEIDLAFSVNEGVEVTNDTGSALYSKKNLAAIALNGEKVATGIKSNYKVFSRIFSKEFH